MYMAGLAGPASRTGGPLLRASLERRVKVMRLCLNIH